MHVRPFRSARPLVALGLALGSVVAVTGPAGDAAAAPSQITIWNHTGSQTASSYWEPSLTQPANYKTPTNYADGKAYIKIEVLTKPSAKSMIPGVCFWRHADGQNFKFETCASTRAYSFTKPGTYYIPLGTPSSWWKKGGSYDWTKQASVGRIMLKDPATGTLFLSSKCGQHCYKGGDLGQHIPVKMKSELVFVAKGANLNPPSGWNCPSGWGNQCSGTGSTDGGSTGGGSTDGGSTGGGSTGGGSTDGGQGTATTPEVTVTAGNGSLAVSWGGVDGANQYQFRYRAPNQNWNWDKPAPTQSRTVNGLANGTTYEVAVRALISGTWREWTTVNATPVGASTGGGGGGGGEVAEPTGTTPTLRVTAGNRTLTASWDAMPGVNLYQFRYNANGGWQWDKPATTRTRTVSGLTNGVEHTVEVRALIDQVWREWTTVVVTPSA